jgi:hypothetical protein
MSQEMLCLQIYTGDAAAVSSHLLGFDHAGRGYRMLADWEAPASKETGA